MATETQAERAQSLYDAGDLAGARELALAGLKDEPADAELLRVAGRASLELGLPDAAEHLERLLELRPDDEEAQVDLAFLAGASGRTDAAVQVLEQALERDPANPAALRGLAAMRPGSGRLDAALELWRSRPGDVSAALEAADVALELDRLDEAREIFETLLRDDAEAEHAVFAYHGLIETELRRERWRPALDLAVEATRVDRHGRTTDILAFVAERLFGAGAAPAPSIDEVAAALADSRAEHRYLHSDDALAA